MKKLYAVLGNPIGHSMSPQMHNDLFDFYNIDAHYQPLLVKEELLFDAVKGLRAIGISGFNVTVPHKTSIMPLLDEIDPLAAAIGAVNTVVNENGRFIGYNTDGPGFLKGLERLIPGIKDKRILIIGAGGAARAIYYTMARDGAQKIDIYNRTVQNADELISSCPYSADSAALPPEDMVRALPGYHLIIQTTSVGMYPQTEESPLMLSSAADGTYVCDIIYNPLETRLLRDAKDKGLKIQNGIDMFVFQGALAFEKWTGIFPDTDRMKKNVLKQLGGTIC